MTNWCLMYSVQSRVQLHEQCYNYRWIQKGYNDKETYSYTTVSFVEGEGSPNLCVAYHPSALSYAFLSM
jgi:hypothetical protein